MTNNITSESSKKNFESMKVQIEQMKKRLGELDRVLNVQTKAIDLIDQGTNSLAREANQSKNETSVEAIMKNVFSKKTLPKILQKNQGL